MPESIARELVRGRGLPAASGVAFLFLAASSVVAAGILPIEGIFGNDDGCHLFMSGQYRGEDLALLTPHTFTTAMVGCYFEELIERSQSRFVVAASCSIEGDPEAVDERIEVIGLGATGIVLDVESVGEIGPLKPCPGTEFLFERRGVPV